MVNSQKQSRDTGQLSKIQPLSTDRGQYEKPHISCQLANVRIHLHFNCGLVQNATSLSQQLLVICYLAVCESMPDR